MVKAFKLEGSSMLPLFKAGQTICAAPLIPRLSSFILSAGDCAVYEYAGRILLHRVVITDDAGAWFSDDAGRIASHYVPWRDIKGKVVSGNPFAAGLPGLIYSKSRRLVSFLIGILRKQ